MKIIIYKPETGIVKIIPAKNIDIETQIHLVPKGADYKIVDVSDIPEDKDFYRALTYDLIIDVNKAKEIKKNNLRAEREPLLKELDVKYMISLETGFDSTDIISEKQRLRDITKLVDACKTIDDIRKIEV